MVLISLVVAFLFAIGGAFYYQSLQTSHAVEPVAETTHETDAPSSSSTSVNRSGQNLSKMPADILAMTNIQKLDLSNNKLTGALPAEIRHLQNLQVLDISNNRMTGLPAELGQLSKLRILNASNNQLTGIPHEIGNLQSLEVLNLSGNDVSEQDLNVIRARLPAGTQIIL